MNKFDPEKNLGEISSTIFINYIFSIFTLSLIAVLSLFSAIYLLLSIYLINNYKIKEYLVNYPWILKSIIFAEKVNKVWIVIEISLAMFAILIIFISSFLFLGLSFDD
jgi:hypothetical protein